MLCYSSLLLLAATYSSAIAGPLPSRVLRYRRFDNATSVEQPESTHPATLSTTTFSHSLLALTALHNPTTIETSHFASASQSPSPQQYSSYKQSGNASTFSVEVASAESPISIVPLDPYVSSSTAAPITFTNTQGSVVATASPSVSESTTFVPLGYVPNSQSQASQTVETGSSTSSFIISYSAPPTSPGDSGFIGTSSIPSIAPPTSASGGYIGDAAAGAAGNQTSMQHQMSTTSTASMLTSYSRSFTLALTSSSQPSASSLSSHNATTASTSANLGSTTVSCSSENTASSSQASSTNTLPAVIVPNGSSSLSPEPSATTSSAQSTVTSSFYSDGTSSTGSTAIHQSATQPAPTMASLSSASTDVSSFTSSEAVSTSTSAGQSSPPRLAATTITKYTLTLSTTVSPSQTIDDSTILGSSSMTTAAISGATTSSLESSTPHTHETPTAPDYSTASSSFEAGSPTSASFSSSQPISSLTTSSASSSETLPAIASGSPSQPAPAGGSNRSSATAGASETTSAPGGGITIVPIDTNAPKTVTVTTTTTEAKETVTSFQTIGRATGKR